MAEYCPDHGEIIETDDGKCHVCLEYEEVPGPRGPIPNPVIPMNPVIALPEAEGDDEAEPADEDGEQGEDELADDEPIQNEANAAATANEVDKVIDRLGKIRDDQFVILMFGFKTAGKTWLLERMKERLFKKHRTRCDPPHKQPEDEDDTLKLEGTTQIEFHTVLESTQPYFIIDIPGERTNDVLSGNYSALRGMLAAMVRADAIIVAMPADLIVFGHLFPKLEKGKFYADALGDGDDVPEEVAEWVDAMRLNNRELNQFTNSMQRIAGILSYMETNEIDPGNEESYKQLVTEDNVAAHLGDNRNFYPVGGVDGANCPTFFALTKADWLLSVLLSHDDATIEHLNKELRETPQGKILQAIAERHGLHKLLRPHVFDPWTLVSLQREELHDWICHDFPLSKFDYTTAFYGHTGGKTLSGGHYDQHPSHGVMDVLEWIAWAQRLKAMSPRKRRAVTDVRKWRELAQGKERKAAPKLVRTGKV